MDMKTNETLFNFLVSDFLYTSGKTHEDRYAGIVHHYGCYKYSDVYDFKKNILKIFHKKSELYTGSEHVVEFFDVKLLASVSWCEHTVYVMFYNSVKELIKSVKNSMEFYTENEGVEYKISAEDFIHLQN